MPKDTFYNLPESKREMIEEVVIDEFAEYGYENASINRIVDKCGIAKGSFYQYFVDKKDLFLHILQMISLEKVKYVTPTMQNPEAHDFFSLVKDLYISGMQFAAENMKLARIGNDIVKNMGSPIYNEIIDNSLPTAESMYVNLLQLAISRGEIREDIDIKYVSKMLMSLSITNFEYWMETHNGEFDFQEYRKSFLYLVEMQLDYIKNGIAKR